MSTVSLISQCTNAISATRHDVNEPQFLDTTQIDLLGVRNDEAANSVIGEDPRLPRCIFTDRQFLALDPPTLDPLLDLVVVAIMSIGALALAFVAIFGIGLFIQAESIFSKTIVPMIFPLVALGISLGTVLSGRNLTYASFDIQGVNLAEEVQGGEWPLRVISFMIVGLCAGKVASSFFSANVNHDGRSFSLFIGFLAFYIFNNLVNGIFGTHPAFVHNSLYAVMVFWAGVS